MRFDAAAMDSSHGPPYVACPDADSRVTCSVCGTTAYTQNGFKLLSEKEIHARVIGQDITDSFHW